MSQDMQKVNMDNIAKQSEFMQRLVSISRDQKQSFNEYRKDFDSFRKSFTRRDGDRGSLNDYFEKILKTRLGDKGRPEDSGNNFIKAVVDRIVNSRSDSGTQLQQKVAEDTRVMREYNLRMANALEVIKDSSDENKKAKERDDLVGALGARFDESLLKNTSSQETGIFGAMLKSLGNIAGILTRGFARLLIEGAVGIAGGLGKGGKSVGRLAGLAGAAGIGYGLYDLMKSNTEEPGASNSALNKIMKDLSGEESVIQKKETQKIEEKKEEVKQTKEENSILDKINKLVGGLGEGAVGLGVMKRDPRIAFAGAGLVSMSEVLDKIREGKELSLKDFGLDISKLRMPTMEDLKNPLKVAERMDKGEEIKSFQADIRRLDNKIDAKELEKARSVDKLSQEELDKKYKEWKEQTTKVIAQPQKAEDLKISSDLPWLNELLGMQQKIQEDIQSQIDMQEKASAVNINNVNTNNVVGGQGGEISLPKVPTSDQDPVVQYFNRAKGIFGF